MSVFHPGHGIVEVTFASSSFAAVDRFYLQLEQLMKHSTKTPLLLLVNITWRSIQFNTYCGQSWMIYTSQNSRSFEATAPKNSSDIQVIARYGSIFTLSYCNMERGNERCIVYPPKLYTVFKSMYKGSAPCISTWNFTHLAITKYELTTFSSWPAWFFLFWGWHFQNRSVLKAREACVHLGYHSRLHLDRRPG